MSEDPTHGGSTSAIVEELERRKVTSLDPGELFSVIEDILMDNGMNEMAANITAVEIHDLFRLLGMHILDA